MSPSIAPYKYTREMRSQAPVNAATTSTCRLYVEGFSCVETRRGIQWSVQMISAEAWKGEHSILEWRRWSLTEEADCDDERRRRLGGRPIKVSSHRGVSSGPQTGRHDVGVTFGSRGTGTRIALASSRPAVQGLSSTDTKDESMSTGPANCILSMPTWEGKGSGTCFRTLS